METGLPKKTKKQKTENKQTKKHQCIQLKNSPSVNMKKYKKAASVFREQFPHSYSHKSGVDPQQPLDILPERDASNAMTIAASVQKRKRVRVDQKGGQTKVLPT